MNEKTIKKLIKLVEDSEIDQLEVSNWGRKVKITRRLPASSNGHGEHHFAMPATPVVAPPPPAPAPQPTSALEPAASDADKDYVEIKSPMVGTFYSAPAPDASPYVKVGERISVGQVVCIVEAMKLMNEIESEVTGKIAKVMVNNAQPVEFGQVLFLIDPKG
ncbi:MAG: acetyl-CoA carboxylase biotin carboxyl carrier protein [candidate division Zixibacteria bacterium]|nr:acetyl-CoA carboxylase biotin carboxyl carrier protein [candidate division Zixibacteria bacterium]